MRTGLRGHITALMPQEIILPRKGLTATTSKVLRASLRNPRQHQLTPGDGFWDAERTLQEIKEAAYFNPTNAEQAYLPQPLQVSVLHHGDNPDALHTAMCLASPYNHSLTVSYCSMRKLDVGTTPAELDESVLCMLYAGWLKARDTTCVMHTPYGSAQRSAFALAC